MSAAGPSSGARPLLRVFGAPLLLAAVSFAGLIGALLTEGPADALWSAAVAAPLAVLAWRLFRR